MSVMIYPSLTGARVRRRACLMLGLLWGALLFFSAEAREVRVASFNIENRNWEVGSDKYEAIKAILQRVDADVVGFQELLAGSSNSWVQLSSELGYPYRAWAERNSPLDGSIYVGYYSRYPITDQFSVNSPPGANEMTRLPLRVVIDVPDAQRPLVIWNMHHKASSGSGDKFRRAIEAHRIIEDMESYLMDHPEHVEYIMLGDLNDDDEDNQSPDLFHAQPSVSFPASYQLGEDITFPVPYATFPTDQFTFAGEGMFKVDAFQEGTTSRATRPASGRQLDYIFVSSAIWNHPRGQPTGEIYYSLMDTGTGGLPKAGSALPPLTSTNASDHLAVFVDLYMADFSPVMPGDGFTATGERGGPFGPDIAWYTVSNTNEYDVTWNISTDVNWLTIEPDTLFQPFATFDEVEITVNANAASLWPGVHIGSVIFSNATTGDVVFREITLNILDDLVISPSEGLAASGTFGGPFAPDSKTYVVTNKHTEPVAFTAAGTQTWITVTPSSWTLLAGQSVDVTVSVNANANGLSQGIHEDIVTFSNQLTGLTHTRSSSVEVFGLLCVAVDNCDLVWTTGGAEPWFYQTDVTFDGVDAAQSGALTDPGHISWMETVVTGPAWVGFRWKVSSRPSWDYLRFHVNGTLQSSRSGEGDWLLRTHELASGVHTLRWEYARSSVTPLGVDAGWVDQVVVDYLIATPTSTYSVSGPPGGPFSPATRVYTLTNAGPHAIDWSLDTPAGWLTATPESGTLSPGSGTTFTAGVTTAANTLSAGAYSGSIIISNATLGTTFSRAVALTVQDYLSVNPSFLYFTGISGGPYAPTSQTYTLSNTGSESIPWSLTGSVPWLSFSDTNGLIAPGNSVQIDVSINTDANILDPGFHFAMLTFSNANSGVNQTRWNYLELQEAAIVTPTAEWTPTGPVGGPFLPATETYTITNRTAEVQTWAATSSTSWLVLNSSGGAIPPNSSTQITAQVHVEAGLLPKGRYEAAITFSNTATGGTLIRPAALMVGMTLCEALDACELSWTTGGNASWFHQSEETNDGVDAAASGTITHNQESWMETAVSGPGTLQFHWKVHSESGWDFLEFRINGTLQSGRLSGNVDWQQKTYVLGSGAHTLHWRYMKDGSVSVGADRGWVDQVSWIPERTAMGVPTAWYQGFGLGPTNGETWDALDYEDAGGNGTPNWQHYVTGLDPTDPASLFRILRVDQAPGQAPRIEWLGGLYGPANSYLIQSATNAVSGPWITIGSSPRAAGTNTWTGDTPLHELNFFRVLAVPDP